MEDGMTYNDISFNLMLAVQRGDLLSYTPAGMPAGFHVDEHNGLSHDFTPMEARAFLSGLALGRRAVHNPA